MDYIETGLFHDVSSAPPGPHSNFDGDLKKKKKKTVPAGCFLRLVPVGVRNEATTTRVLIVKKRITNRSFRVWLIDETDRYEKEAATSFTIFQSFFIFFLFIFPLRCDSPAVLTPLEKKRPAPVPRTRQACQAGRRPSSVERTHRMRTHLI